jgi:potassium efflux system protein
MLPWLTAHMETALFRFNQTPVTPLSILIFIGILVFTVILARIVRRAVTRFLRKRGEANEGMAYAIGRISQYVVYAMGFIFALDNVGIDLAAFAAVGAVITVGVGFGMQNVAQNFISGLILLIERPVQKGDYILVGETVGTVVSIEMRATKVVSPDGVAIIVPNSELISKNVLNETFPTSKKRVSVAVGVAYGSDVPLVKETLLALAAMHEQVLKDPLPEVFFRNFADSSLEFALAVWLPHPQVEPLVTSDLRFAIERTFREKNIEIPFPQRDVHVRQGLVSG